MGLFDWLFGRNHQTVAPPSFEPMDDSASTTGVAVLEEYGAPDTDAGTPWWSPTGVAVIEPVEPERPELSTEARAIESLIVSHFDGRDLSMPALLPVAEMALARLRDPRCSLPEIGEVVSSDPVVSGAVLRMANSPLYRGLDRITSLSFAVTRLGTNALRTLMLHESVRAAMFERRGGDPMLADRIWRQSLAGAVIMRGLSEFTPVDPDQAFLIGLLHNIGNVIVLRIVQAEELADGQPLDLVAFDYLCHESHQEFGELVADAWHLPSDLKSLISNHHRFPESDDPLKMQRCLIIAGDMVASMLGYGPEATYDLLHAPAFLELGLPDRHGFTSFLDRLPEELAEWIQDVQE